ncbi:hypothetical protein Leryth_018906 [Lithospermum erythrorhizon]|nr:hypothetical protein Leryth_018906 [Lithospermum erythrorhizon]
MEIEYCKTSGAQSSDASSSTGFKLTERICPYPTFNNPLATYNLIKRNHLQVDINKLKFQKESQKPQNEIMKRSTAVRLHPKKNGDHKTSSNKRRKSKVASSWPNLRLLGC